MKIFAATRRGRPAIRPAKDKAANDNERSNARDEGTPELRRMRHAVAGGADAAASGHPLALLLAKALIDKHQHQAGLRFGGLYRLVIGRIDISYQRLYEGLAGYSGARRPAIDERDLEKARARYLRARAALEKEGRAVARDTENLVVFGAWPAFLIEPAPANSNRARDDEAYLNRLRKGVDALERELR